MDVIEKIKKNSESIKNILYRNKKDLLKSFFVLCAIYIIALIPIIRANYNYIDDIGRVDAGYRGWQDFYRWINTYLSIFIHAERRITDISPVPQLIAVCILSISSISLIYILSGKKEFNIFAIIAAVPLGLSPFFLECLSYKFDAPYMALSVFFSIIPFFIYKKQSKYFVTVSIITVLATCMTYQASLGIYPMITLFIVFKKWTNGETHLDIFKFILKCALSYIVAIFIFKIIMIPNQEAYRQTSMLPLNQLIPGMLINIKEYFHTIISDFERKWLVIIGFLVFSFVVISSTQSKRNKLLTVFVSIFLFVLSGALSFGIYSALQNPIYIPRTMYGFGVLIALIGIYITSYKRFYVSKVLSITLCWMFIVFAATCGNALAEQKRYTDYRIQLVIDDLNELNIYNTQQTIKLELQGTIGKSEIITSMNKKLLDKYIPDTFGGNWFWSQEYFFNYFGLKQKNIVKSTLIKDKGDMTLIKSSLFHDIYIDDEYILVELK